MPHRANRCLVLALVALVACGGTDAPSDPEPSGDGGGQVALVGAWQTSGEDPKLGPVDVRLELQVDGGLRVSLVPPTGATLTFGGSWSLTADTLVLHGAYFGTTGQARAAWILQGDTLLVLQDSTGTQQQWRRR